MTRLEELQARKDAYLAAELKILQSQEYQVGQGQNSRRNTRAELETVRKAIAELDDLIGQAAAAATARRRVYNLRPGC